MVRPRACPGRAPEGIVIARLMHQGMSYSEAKAQIRQEEKP